MYVYNSELYRQWRIISHDQLKGGGSTSDPGEIIRKAFNSSYIFLEDQRNPQLKQVLEADPEKFLAGYQGEGVSVYKIVGE
jgi:hypothetical protein